MPWRQPRRIAAIPAVLSLALGCTGAPSAPGTSEHLGPRQVQGEAAARLTPDSVSRLLEDATGGSSEAQVRLGNVYAHGDGVTIDDGEAVRWYRTAAEAGNPEAQRNLAVMYVFGHGVERDDGLALEWYRKSVEGWDPRMQPHLGHMFGYTESMADDERTLRWIKEPRNHGHRDAGSNIGHMYPWGIGVPGDEAGAVLWFHEAAAGGEAAAQLHLGHMYASGEGVQRDEAEALRWYREAASAGNHLAEAALAFAYEQGRGVRQDPVRAYVWASLAEARVPEARELRKDLEAKLSEEQLREATRLSQELRESGVLR